MFPLKTDSATYAGRKVVFVTHVDDGIYAGPTNILDEFEAELKDKLEVQLLERPEWLLGMEISVTVAEGY